MSLVISFSQRTKYSAKEARTITKVNCASLYAHLDVQWAQPDIFLELNHFTHTQYIVLMCLPSIQIDTHSVIVLAVHSTMHRYFRKMGPSIGRLC